ncbi:hypothetical protein ACHAQJ_010532 [Trichoderma viride]
MYRRTTAAPPTEAIWAQFLKRQNDIGLPPMSATRDVCASQFQRPVPQEQMNQQYGNGVYENAFHAKPSQGQAMQQLLHADSPLAQYQQDMPVNTFLADTCSLQANSTFHYSNVDRQWHPVPITGIPGARSFAPASVATANTATEPRQATTPAAWRNGASLMRPRSLAQWDKDKSRALREARATAVGTPTDIDMPRQKINQVLHSVLSKGLRTASHAIFQKLLAEVQMTHSVIGLPLNPDEEQRATSNIYNLSNMMLGMLFQPIDLTAETAEIWAEVEKARTAMLFTNPDVESGTCYQNDNPGTVEKPKMATPSRPVPAQKDNTKPIQKRSIKPVQGSGKASSSKANGKDERQFILTGPKRTLVNGGRESISYFCSDGQWRVLQDGPLEEAQRRTEAVKASSGGQKSKTGSKRRNEAGDKKQTKKARSKVQEMTPPMTATNSSSPGGQDLLANVEETNEAFTPPATVKNSSSPDDEGIFNNPAAADLTFTSSIVVKDSPSPDGESILAIPAAGDETDNLATAVEDSSSPDDQSPFTVPTDGNQLGADSQYSQVSLSLEEAKKNYVTNYQMIANAPQDFFIEQVPPIPPVRDEGEFADLLWLGRQMDEIQSSFK